MIVALAGDLSEARALLERYRAFDENGDGRQLRVDTDAFLERTK